ncbi:MAG: hypothetical protein M1819_001450 [Sarea resinae]|nr:MAG: hypothetical protein M1819_001450 [Sarea resinae]
MHVSSDPLPFQCLSRYPTTCQNARFVDVDYEQLMWKKTETISSTEQLREWLTNVEIGAPDQTIMLRSSQYLAVGCDLRNMEKLTAALEKELGNTDCRTLFIAEVSITYMDVEAADSVISWAARFNDSHFCLLEQILPDGPDHPFASTMMGHFNKLGTPLKSVLKYPKLEDQRQRFVTGGWPLPVATTLWDLWGSSLFLSAEKRMHLDSVEPFDEWEEFALFGSHYILLIASKDISPDDGRSTSPAWLELFDEQKMPSAHPATRPSVLGQCQFSENPKGYGQRRFGALLPVAKSAIGYHGGIGVQARLNNSDIYAGPSADFFDKHLLPPPMQARVCHTISDLNGGDCLLVGGRASPDKALSDCWLREEGTWQQVEELPMGRYRHCASTVSLTGAPVNSFVLVFGGKNSEGKVLDDWICWHTLSGWQEVHTSGSAPVPRFGASMVSMGDHRGIMLGGMDQESLVLSDCWEYTFSCSDTPILTFRNLSLQFQGDPAANLCFNRLGSQLLRLDSSVIVVGGIAGHGLLHHSDEFMILNPDQSSIMTMDVEASGVRPLLVGFALARTENQNIQLFGGGAVCFSFGTYWNTGVWSLRFSEHEPASPWLLRIEDMKTPAKGASAGNYGLSIDGHATVSGVVGVMPVPRIHIAKARDFERLVNKARPAIIEGLDIGICTKEWSLDYLKEKIGADHPVVVHEAKSEFMSFNEKNFSYVTKPFGQFLDAINQGEKEYLRSLASDKPLEKPSEVAHDFPPISSDFRLPPELALVTTNAHSSPLRISGPVTVWLHYDVMANVLCQIRGTKRILVYPPSDVNYLAFPPGASSSSINVFEADTSSHPLLAHAHPFEAILRPGDVLFIPALWLHTTTSTDGLSVSINVFFRNLKAGYAAGRDVYGNRDLQAYEKGRKDIEKITKSFEGLPLDMGRFYLERLAGELQERARAFGSYR